jgi:P27 family predicted phage terminase small subunit
MTRGRKPKPTALKLIEGNPGKRAVNDAEPNAGPVGDPPGDLDGIALTKWFEMARLWRLVLTAADRDQLAEYCRLEAERIEAMEKIKVDGPVAMTAGGAPVQSAWKIILNKCREDMRKIAVEFGGTPASRARVKSNGEAPQSKFGGLLKAVD